MTRNKKCKGKIRNGPHKGFICKAPVWKDLDYCYNHFAMYMFPLSATDSSDCRGLYSTSSKFCLYCGVIEECKYIADRRKSDGSSRS